MITFRAVVIPGGARRDGTYPVKIRVTFRRQTRRLPTTLIAAPEDLTRSLKIKSPTLLTRSDELIARMRTAVADLDPFQLEGKDIEFVVAHIREALGADGFRLDFFAWSAKYLSGKKTSTRLMYETALNALERFLGRRELDVNDITRGMLLDFVDFVDAEPKMHYVASRGVWEPGSVMKDPHGAAARHLMKLGHLYNAAKDRYNDEDRGRILIPRSPFSRVKVVAPPSTHGQKNLGVDVIQRIIAARPEHPKTRASLDVFLLSFVLMGVNLADLYEAKNGVFEEYRYFRKKTRDRRPDRAEMRVVIPPEADLYIARLQDGPKGWWLPKLHELGSRAELASKTVDNRLKAWAFSEGLEPFTMGAARHSWASIARGPARVEKATVDECLVHVGDFDLTDIYAERSWLRFAEANRRVLDLFRWE